MDERFDRVYFLETESGELEKVKHLCEYYNINDNGAFDNAAPFYFNWGFGPEEIIYISPTTFLSHKQDFNFVEELESFIDKFSIKN